MTDLLPHPKPKLLAMLDDMGAPEPRAAVCKQDELVGLVAQRAAEQGWAPAYLSWAAEPPTDDAPDDEEPLVASRPDSGAHQPITA